MDTIVHRLLRGGTMDVREVVECWENRPANLGLIKSVCQINGLAIVMDLLNPNNTNSHPQYENKRTVQFLIRNMGTNEQT